MRCLRTVIVLAMVAFAASCMAGTPPPPPLTIPDDPVFDFQQIISDALDVRLLKSTEREGVVVEEIEYTAHVWNGKPVRIYGIQAYPKGGRDLPAIFWSQGGMYRAGEYWPITFAKKGYFALNITLPHDVYNSFARFTTEDVRRGNLTGLAVAQMRGITCLSQRPEVDKTRIGVGGSSYGGFFATLIAGADPRVKAGMSFFTSGNHHLGTNYPQFNQLRTADEVGIWLGTIDPGWRLRRKAVPFLFAVAANDHWQHLPAAAQTYMESIGEKRLSIIPNWAHAFPANIDQMLIDWFDVYLAGARKPYNQPGEITAKSVGGKLVASWDWTGENPIRKAELVVSYGDVRPWHCWVHRYHHTIPAKIDGRTAAAEIPVFEPGFEMLAYGNITDDHDVVTSTLPITVQPDKLGVAHPTATQNINTVLVTDFSPDEMTFLARHGTPVPGKPDTAQKQAGAQSLRIDDPKAAVWMKLGHVPERGHRLTLWLKADKRTTIEVEVLGVPLANWTCRIVDILRRRHGGTPNVDPRSIKPPGFTLAANVDTQWRRFALDCPFDGTPVEGYNLRLRQSGEAGATYWLDTLRLEPRWE